MIGERRAILRTREREDDLQLPAELQRNLGRDLVGAIGDWRDEAKARRIGREIFALALEQRSGGIRHKLKDVVDSLAKRIGASGREAVGAMASNSDRHNERQSRRARTNASRRNGFKLCLS